VPALPPSRHGRRRQVIMLSARGQASDREAGLQAGADAYLVKPFSPLQLISCIGELWAAA
jgi:DNA-binding response OmpR family regulator